MYKVEIDLTLCRIIKVYRGLCVWRNEGDSDFRSSYIRIFHFFLYFTFTIYLLIGIYDEYLRDDINQLIFLVEVEITALIVLLKLAYLLWRKDEFLKFLYDPIVAHCTEDYGESVEAENKVEKFSTFTKVYTRALLCNFLFVILVPLPIFTSDENMLPLFIRFNFESDYEMVLYWIVYLYISFAVFLCVMYSCSVLLIWYIMYNYSIEYKLVGNRFRLLGTTASKTYNQELIHLIRVQVNLFQTVERFRACFSALFLVQMTTSAIFICISTYNLSYNTPDNLFEMLIYSAFLPYSFFEIYVTMHLANEITVESKRLSYCLFESNWIDQSQSTKKFMIIFGEMIKTPQQLVIFIYPMNLEKFTSIVNGAYSLFNVMKSFK